MPDEDDRIKYNLKYTLCSPIETVPGEAKLSPDALKDELFNLIAIFESQDEAQ